MYTCSDITGIYSLNQCDKEIKEIKSRLINNHLVIDTGNLMLHIKAMFPAHT